MEATPWRRRSATRGGSRYEWLIRGISLATAAVGLVLAIVWRNYWLGGFALVLGGAERWSRSSGRGWSASTCGRSASSSQRQRPAVEAHEVSASIEGFLAPVPSAPGCRAAPALEDLQASLQAGLQASRATPAPPAQRASPPPPPLPPQRPALPPPPSPQRASRREPEDLELPLDSQFLGGWLLDNGLAELALPSLRTAFTQASTPQTGHALATALLEAQRYPELTRLLSSPDAAHLGDETLQLIATRAEAAGQPALATRARELRQGRASARAPRA